MTFNHSLIDKFFFIKLSNNRIVEEKNIFPRKFNQSSKKLMKRSLLPSHRIELSQVSRNFMDDDDDG